MNPNPLLHSPRVCAGYRSGSVLGDCGHRYRPPALTSLRRGHRCSCGLPADFALPSGVWRCGLCVDGIRLDVSIRGGAR